MVASPAAAPPVAESAAVASPVVIDGVPATATPATESRASEEREPTAENHTPQWLIDGTVDPVDASVDVSATDEAQDGEDSTTGELEGCGDNGEAADNEQSGNEPGADRGSGESV